MAPQTRVEAARLLLVAGVLVPAAVSSLIYCSLAVPVLFFVLGVGIALTLGLPLLGSVFHERMKKLLGKLSERNRMIFLALRDASGLALLCLVLAHSVRTSRFRLPLLLLSGIGLVAQVVAVSIRLKSTE